MNSSTYRQTKGQELWSNILSIIVCVALLKLGNRYQEWNMLIIKSFISNEPPNKDAYFTERCCKFSF